MADHDATGGVLPEGMRQHGCTVTGLLGAGGMGWVYGVSDPRLARTVALKIARGAADSFSWRRLQREARITAGLETAGVPAVHEIGTLADGRPWFSMSLATGSALGAVEGRSPSQRLAVAHRLSQVCAILAPIHAAGVIHRDLKPANIRVGERVTILDWGLARVLTEGTDTPAPSEAQTRAGARLGTPSRMSPEQAAGLPVDARADVWALGVLLWEVLSGTQAYPGERAPAVIARVLQGPPPMAPVAWAGPALVGVIEGALAPLPDRFPDAGALHDALQAALRLPPRPPRRRGVVWAVSGALLLAALLAFGVGDALRPAPTPALPPSTELHTSLALAAQAAAREGIRYRAERLAADALEHGGDRALRGLLLSSHPRPILELDVEYPHCGIGEQISPDASLLACANPGFTTGYGIEEDGLHLRWRQDVEIHQFEFLGLDTVLGQVPSQASVVLLDAGHGGPLWASLRMGSGQLMPSRRPDTLLRLLNGVRSREVWGRRQVPRFDERPAPCSALRAVLLADGSELHACTGEVLRLDGETLAVQARWPMPSADARTLRMRLDATGARVALMLYSGQHAIITLDDNTITWSPKPFSRAGDISISPSGRYVAIGSFLGTAVWERANPTQPWLLPGRSKTVNFDMQDRLILQGYRHLQRWRLPTSSPRAWPAGERIQELDWGGGGLLARRVDGAVVRWPDGAVIAEDAEHVATAPGHSRVAISRSDGLVQVIGQPPFSPGGRCRSLEWLDDATLVCAPAGPGPLLLDADSGAVDQSVGLPGTSWFTAAGHGEGTVALLEWSGAVFKLDGSPPRLTRSATESWSNTMALSPDGASVMLGGSRGSSRLDLTTHALTERFPLQTRISRIACSPDGRWMAMTTYEGDLYLYRDDALEAHMIFSSSQTLLAAFSPDSQQLAMGGSTGIIEVLELAELDRPLEAVIAEVRVAWGEVHSRHGR